MSTIVKRITKGTTLTLAELDANINNLNVGKLEVSGGTLTGRPKLANQDIDIIEPKYPTIKPSLNLDFVSSRQLDPRVTFARNCSASYYDGKTTAKAEENLLTGSNDFGNAAYWGGQIVAVSATNLIAPDNTNTAAQLDYSTGGSGQAKRHGFTFSANTTYTISIYVKSLSGDTTFSFDLENADNQTLTITPSWQRFVWTITPTVARTWVDLQLASTGSVAVWGAQVEQRSSVTAYTPTTTAPITNYIPVLKFAQPNVPRLDYDPITGKALGLLIEESRTNLLSYSSNFSNAAWEKSTSTLYYNYVVAPDGTQTATLLGPTVSVTPYQALNIVAGTTYVYSVYVKAITGTTISFRMSPWNSISGDQYRTFTASTGTIVRVTGDAGSIQTATPVGNGWYRLVMISVTDKSVSGYVSIENGNGFAVWGAQVEVYGLSQAVRSSTIGTGSTTTDIVLDSGASAVDGTYVGNRLAIANAVQTISAYVGATKTATVSVAFATAPTSGAIYAITPISMTIAGFATSYIPTTTGAVTRVADQASMTGTNFSSWYNISQGSFYVEHDILMPAGTNSILLNGNNSNQNFITLYGSDPITRSYDGTTLTNVGNSIRFTTNKVAISINGTALLGTTNGLTPVSSTWSKLSILAMLGIGSNGGGGSSSINSHIRKLTYYPKALTSTELVALTS